MIVLVEVSFSFCHFILVRIKISIEAKIWPRQYSVALYWFLLVQGVVFHMWFFLMIFFLCFFVMYVYREMSLYQNTHVYSISKLALWQLGVSPGIIEGVLVAWGHHVHQQPRLIIVEDAVHCMLGKDCFATVVEDNDS